MHAGHGQETINTGPGTRGPGTRGSKDPRTRGSKDPRTQGPEYQGPEDPRMQSLEGCVPLWQLKYNYTGYQCQCYVPNSQLCFVRGCIIYSRQCYSLTSLILRVVYSQFCKARLAHTQSERVSRLFALDLWPFDLSAVTLVVLHATKAWVCRVKNK